MRIKRKNGLKVAAITIALLLCLALAVGITGAWYQAQRQATGTLSMDQGIIIDYKGFGQTPDEGIWTRETTTTFLLFDETNAQPGEEITVNAAGIRANEKSVNFYARVKLSYKFYNGETPVELADATKLIKTSSSFWANSWVDGGSTDGYYYYATGSTLNKFEKTATTFVEVFAADAKFVIEGEGFVGADNNGEGGGFVVGDTSINKIEVYLTLETLQGDADAAAEGWKIAAGQVDFAKVDEGKIVKSNTTEVVTNEQLNVTINGNETKLEEVKFPYDEEVTLNFDSKNVDYITLVYSNGDEETFGLAAEDFVNDYLSETALKVTAKSEKGIVTGYVVGLFNSSEYTGFIYSTECSEFDYVDGELKVNGSHVVAKDSEGNEGIAVSGYLGEIGAISISSEKVKVRKRDFRTVTKGYTDFRSFGEVFNPYSLMYPCKINGKTYNSYSDFEEKFLYYYYENEEQFMVDFPEQVEVISEAICHDTSWRASLKTITEIGTGAFNESSLTSITIPSNIVRINDLAFQNCDSLTDISIPDSVTMLGKQVFYDSGITSLVIPDNTVAVFGDSDFEGCNNLISITIGENVTLSTHAFAHCNSMSAVYIKSSTAPTLILDECGTSNGVPYYYTGNIKYYVPKGSLENYKNDANWNVIIAVVEEQS